MDSVTQTASTSPIAMPSRNDPAGQVPGPSPAQSEAKPETGRAPVLRLATVWLGGCSGCHMSFLDLDEFLFELAGKVELVYSPFIDAKEYPAQVDLCLVEGAVCNEDNLEMIHKVRQRTRVLVSFGDCAVTANVPAIRNQLGLGNAESVLQRAYVETAQVNAGIPGAPSVVPALAGLAGETPALPVVSAPVGLAGGTPALPVVPALVGLAGETPALPVVPALAGLAGETPALPVQVPKAPGIVPALLERVLPVHEAVHVNYYLPGCPPPAERIRAVLVQVLNGTEPKLEGPQLRFG